MDDQTLKLLGVILAPSGVFMLLVCWSTARRWCCERSKRCPVIEADEVPTWAEFERYVMEKFVWSNYVPPMWFGDPEIEEKFRRAAESLKRQSVTTSATWGYDSPAARLEATATAKRAEEEREVKVLSGIAVKFERRILKLMDSGAPVWAREVVRRAAMNEMRRAGISDVEGGAA